MWFHVFLQEAQQKGGKKMKRYVCKIMIGIAALLVLVAGLGPGRRNKILSPGHQAVIQGT